MGTNRTSDSSTNVNFLDLDVEDLRIVSTLLTKYKLGKFPGRSLADELVKTLLEENARLRAEAASLKTKTVTPTLAINPESASGALNNVQLKKEEAEEGERADSLQRQLESSQDTVADQKLTILEMQAKIDLLQRQLKGAERIMID